VNREQAVDLTPKRTGGKPLAVVDCIQLSLAKVIPALGFRHLALQNRAVNAERLVRDVQPAILFCHKSALFRRFAGIERHGEL